MKLRHYNLSWVIWLFAVVSVFSESYPSRPTASELKSLIVSGTQCAKGVNERCYATQYASNTYQVTPFTNTCLYLDQDLMEQMAAKIGSLVPCYVDPDTVYNGTLNVSMLSVTSLWVELDIGDRTNKFTQTFASGTNAVVYGDSPWRIYWENLDERYNVLNALSCVRVPVTAFGSAYTGRDLGPWPNEISYSDLFYGGVKPKICISANLIGNVAIYMYPGFYVDDYFEFHGNKLNNTDLCTVAHRYDETHVGDRWYKGIFLGTFSIGDTITMDVWDTIGNIVRASGYLLYKDLPFQYCK